MRPLEEQLNRALSRREPPEDFTARVLAAVAAQNRDSRNGTLRSWWFRIRGLALATTLAACLIMTASLAYREHQHTARGEQAKEKLLIAVQIAGSKLHRTQQHVIQIEGLGVER